MIEVEAWFGVGDTVTWTSTYAVMTVELGMPGHANYLTCRLREHDAGPRWLLGYRHNAKFYPDTDIPPIINKGIG